LSYRLVKNIDCSNQNIGSKEAIIDEIIGVSQLLGFVSGLHAPQVYEHLIYYF